MCTQISDDVMPSEMLSTCERKETGNIGGFKLLTSSSSIRLQNEITWI